MAVKSITRTDKHQKTNSEKDLARACTTLLFEKARASIDVCKVQRVIRRLRTGVWGLTDAKDGDNIDWMVGYLRATDGISGWMGGCLGAIISSSGFLVA